MSTKEIRETFLSFFVEKDHLRIDPASLLPQNDPTLLFINSGMAPLKRYFLGKASPPSPRLCNVQPCIRTIDIDDVGDRHHLTFFEMLGSWSIGDYYKDKAIALAYELLVDRFGFDPKRLFATVYKGDPRLNLPPDEASAAAWERVGLARDHVVPLGEDNFWGPAGTTGPCGPCTEVFYDTGSSYGADHVPGGHFDTKKRYIEIWNAGVFMEFDKTERGSFEPLPIKSVDTGSGLERMAFVMNGCRTAYETDVLRPVMEGVVALFGKSPVSEENLRIVADHIRAATFIMAEGVLPGNEGHGYIPRRLIRKCVATALRAGVRGADFSPVVASVVSSLGAHYPLIARHQSDVAAHIRKECADFEPVIADGLERLEVDIAGSRAQVYPGKKAFQLAATHGVPIEIVRSFLKEKGVTLDEPGYQACVAEHQEVSRRGRKFGGEVGAGPGPDASELAKGLPKTEFQGYEQLRCESRIIRLLEGEAAKDVVAAGREFRFATGATPFYAESGGQVGDRGTARSGTGEAEIIETSKAEGVVLHRARLRAGELRVGQKVALEVDEGHRQRVRRNHSATHLLHAALRAVLGPQAVQKGSLVDGDRLRFDFQHSAALTRGQIEQLESLVNRWIWQDLRGQTKVCDYQSAVAGGAMALFGENYGDSVRVVAFGQVSAELCGGTHVASTAEIGLMLIESEGSVARGVRRIEAVTGEAALAGLHARVRVLNEVSASLNVGYGDLPKQVQRLRQQAAQAGKAKAGAQREDSQILDQKTVTVSSGVRFYLGRGEADVEALKAAGDRIIQKREAEIACLLHVQKESIRAFVWVEPSLSKTVNAGKVLAKLLSFIDGQGGGKPQFAQGGGRKVEGLTALWAEAEKTVASLVG